MERCIFCSGTFVPGSDGEHIFPDSIGGTLKIKDVCPDCNSHLNTLYDNKFKQQNFTQLAKDAYQILGRRKKEQNYFKHKIGESSIGRIRLTKDFYPELISDFKMGVVEQNGEKQINFNMRIDKNNVDHAVKYLVRNLPDKLKEIHPQKDDDEIENMANDYIEQFKDKCSDASLIQRSRISIKYGANNDFTTVLKEFVKIAFEYSYYIFGGAYLTDGYSQIIKNCLITNTGLETLRAQLFPPFPFSFPSDRHYACLQGHDCIVSTFGLCGVVQVSTEKQFYIDQERAILHEIDPVSKTDTEICWVDFLYRMTGSDAIP